MGLFDKKTCDICGCITQDFTNPPKFCPNCGDAISGADVVL